MADWNGKNATPDTTKAASGFLFGAASQSAANPSIYPMATAAASINAASGVVSVRDYGATGDGETDDSDAFAAAVAVMSEGETLVIPPGAYVLSSGWTVTDKNIGVECQGELLLTDDSGSVIEFSSTPTAVAGTDITLPERGDEALVWSSAPDVDDPSDYFFTLVSTEDEIVRIGGSGYTPFTKNEANAVSSYNWQTKAPIIYTYTDAAKLTVNLFRKGAPITIRGLRVRLLAGDATSKQNRVKLYGLSNVTFDGLLVDTGGLNVPGHSLRIDSCYGLTFRGCKVVGPNSSDGDSYAFLGWISAFLSFYDCENQNAAGATSPKIGRGYSARHCSRVSFFNCRFNGIDDHYGHDYLVDSCRFISFGVLFAGGWITLRNCIGSSAYPLFMLRAESPYADGTLRMEGCQSSNLLVKCRVIPDPNERTTKVKFFDTIIISDCTSDAGTLGTFYLTPPAEALGHTYTKTGRFRVRGLTFNRRVLDSNCSMFNNGAAMARSFAERAEFIDIDYNLVEFTTDDQSAGFLVAELNEFKCDDLYVSNWDHFTAYLAQVTRARVVDSIVGVNLSGAGDEFYFSDGDWTFQGCTLNTVPYIESGKTPTVNIIGCILWKNFLFRLSTAAKYVSASAALSGVSITNPPSGNLQSYISADYKDEEPA